MGIICSWREQRFESKLSTPLTWLFHGPYPSELKLTLLKVQRKPLLTMLLYIWTFLVPGYYSSTCGPKRAVSGNHSAEILDWSHVRCFSDNFMTGLGIFCDTWRILWINNKRIGFIKWWFRRDQSCVVAVFTKGFNSISNVMV